MTTDAASGGETVAELTGRVLAELGVGHAFGVVGSGNFAVTNALRAHGVPYLAARHEGGAASMADGFSRLSALPGILTTHQGCGLTNAMTGIAEAAKSRTPMIVLTADTPAAQIRSNFKIDQDGLVESVGAVAERVHSAASAGPDLSRAYRTAVQGRRTVVVSLPLDVQAAETAPFAVSALSAAAPTRPGAAAVDELVSLLAAAQRPVFIAGRGARGAGAALRALAAQAGALLATSAVANGLFEGDDFHLGISGGFSSPLAAELIGEADLVVSWGCSLNQWTSRHGVLLRNAILVQVDDEDAALGAHRPIRLGVHGDSAVTARDVLEHLTAPAVGYRTPQVRERIRTARWWNQTETADSSTADTIDPRVFSALLDSALPRERVVAIDSGNFMGYPSAYLRVPDENGFCFTQAFQSIGLGLASGLGAALAQPERLPVIAAGDGGFLMSIAELETAVRIGRPMVIAVYNDAAYGAEVHHFGPAHPEADLGTVTFPDVDLASIAHGYGAEGVTVRGRADLEAVRRWSEAPEGVLVIDAKVANASGSWWLEEAFKAH